MWWRAMVSLLLNTLTREDHLIRGEALPGIKGQISSPGGTSKVTNRGGPVGLWCHCKGTKQRGTQDACDPVGGVSKVWQSQGEWSCRWQDRLWVRTRVSSKVRPLQGCVRLRQPRTQRKRVQTQKQRTDLPSSKWCSKEDSVSCALTSFDWPFTPSLSINPNRTRKKSPTCVDRSVDT